MEIRIPASGDDHAEFFPDEKVSGAPPSRTYPWYFNVCRLRNRDGKSQTYAFSPTGQKDFHNVMAFAKLYMR